MSRIFGLDIGTTSIGFAVIDYDPIKATGNILRLGTRIFPEARDPDGTPLNQTRRQKRMLRRQFRRRRERRKALNEMLHAAGLLPAYNSAEWSAIMSGDPYHLRARGLTEALELHEVGRALYHLGQRRHFKGRDLEETDEADGEAADEKEAKTKRDSTLQILRRDKITLGAWLAKRGPHERKRGEHAHRTMVDDEFERLWIAQSKHHASLNDDLKARIKETIFAQRPVFWRKNTLGECRFMPGDDLCPKGAWLSQQRRMLEKLNNLAIASGNARPLDDEERAAILSGLQTQASMTWGGVRKALNPIFKARGDPGAEKTLRFNLELGGETKLLGNAIESKLANIFGDAWTNHPHKQTIRDAIHHRLWSADYGEIGTQRVVIRPEKDRAMRRTAAAQSFVEDFGVTAAQAAKLKELSFPTGWEPYSTAALQKFMPHLENSLRFGALVNGPEWEVWRKQTFPNRRQPTGEILDKLPSPKDKDEQERIATLRNPTVVRTQNELRKVVNNLIGLFGKPDLIRIEVARDVGKSKREREETSKGIAKNERKRKEAIKDLESKNIINPSNDDVEKWLLWKEGQERCPYTGDQISFDALFREGRFDVEHIWPRSMTFDNSLRNKTLCRKDVNIEKGKRIPFRAFSSDPDRWGAIQNRLQGLIMPGGMSPGKVKRFLAESIPEDFTSRQLNDTGYAARQAMAFLKRLWPDTGVEAPVKVEAVTGRVTAQLRKLWTLNNILADDGEKTRADHRHHAVDALVIACTHPGMTNRLSHYWQQRDEPGAQKPTLPPPWPTIRTDADKAVDDIIVSHRVRKKVSGPLHEEMPLGYTKKDIEKNGKRLGIYVKRIPIEKLTLETLKITNTEEITKSAKFVVRDNTVRETLLTNLIATGKVPAKAYPPYPRVGSSGPDIRKVRVLATQQKELMVPTANGFADPANNHHIAIYRLPNGDSDYDIVSLFEAARRLSRREPVVRRTRNDGASFIMSLSPGDGLEFVSGDKKSIRIVQGVWASGQVVTRDHKDADGSSISRPTTNSLLKSGARKISIDPIGRTRPAND